MANTVHDLSGNHVSYLHVPNQAAATATGVVASWSSPFNCNVKSVKYSAAEGNLIGADTNSCNIAAYKDDNTTLLGRVAFTAGTNSNVSGDTTIYSNTQSNAFSVDSGAHVILKREKVGTGLAMPFGTMIVTYQAR